jgi:hypothetical protein
MNVAEAIINKNTKNINTKDVSIVPCNTNVVLDFYEDNPYRTVEVSDSGLILGIESTKRYKSNDTGETEDTEEYIACAKVIAVGPDCKNVKVGEDVFAVKHLANPLPYKKLGYRVLNEANIICRIVENV